MRAELILNISNGLICLFADFALRFSDLKKNLVIDCVSNFEVYELDSVNVVFWLTKKVLRGGLKISYLLER
jgi:hypothetical protein